MPVTTQVKRITTEEAANFQLQTNWEIDVKRLGALSFTEIALLNPIELATTDVTVVEKVVDDDLDYVAGALQAWADKDEIPERYTVEFEKCRRRFFGSCRTLYRSLYPYVLVNEDAIRPRAKYRKTYAPYLTTPAYTEHIDEPVEDVLSATFNFTLYTAHDGWSWLLSNAPKTVDERDVKAVPLVAGGLIIMGEWARFNSRGKWCTVGHEINAPVEDQSGEEIKRINALIF